MPIYRYKCSECGLETEEMKSFTSTEEDEPPECPEDVDCPDDDESGSFERMIGKPNAHFSGSGEESGFYSNREGVENPASS